MMTSDLSEHSVGFQHCHGNNVRAYMRQQDDQSMKRKFTASLRREDNWFGAQCLEVDVASQGETEEEAMANLGEALELHFGDPRSTIAPLLRTVEVGIVAP